MQKGARRGAWGAGQYILGETLREGLARGAAGSSKEAVRTFWGRAGATRWTRAAR